MTQKQILATNLAVLAQTYLAQRPQSLSSLSSLVAADDGFLRRVREGGGFTIGKYDRAVQRFSDYWPDPLPWPDGIARPKAEPRVQIIRPRRRKLSAA